MPEKLKTVINPEEDFTQGLDYSEKNEAGFDDLTSGENPDFKAEQNFPIKNETDKYNPEHRQKIIHEMAEEIRTWAESKGFIEGTDYMIVEDIYGSVKDKESQVPHDKDFKRFAMGIQEDRYQDFRDYFTNDFKQKQQKENPNFKVWLDYSWAGRFMVAGVDAPPLDTVPMSDVAKGIVLTHHNEFRQYFKGKTGFDFPTAAELNIRLKKISDKWRSKYQEAYQKLTEMAGIQELPSDVYGLIDALGMAVKILEKEQAGDALIDLSEIIQGEMPAEMMRYADLTYNAEHLKNLDKAFEIAGIEIPDEAKIDRLIGNIFSQKGFDKKQIDELCRDLPSYIETKKELNKMLK